MKRYRIFNFVLILILMFNFPVFLSANNFPEENNSEALADELGKLLIENPSDKNLALYTGKLNELAPAVGRTKVLSVFHKVLGKFDGDKNRLSEQILRLSINELNNNYSGIENNFSIIRRWNISGPWKKYGKPDINYGFNPEKIFKVEDVEKGRSISADENGVIYPYKYNHEPDETLYATFSLLSETGVVLWIISDSEYKLIINGREVSLNGVNGRKTVKAFSLKGARGYTVQIKMQSGGEKNYPYIKGMITDEKHLPVKLISSGIVFNYNFTFEKIFSSEEAEKDFSGEAFVLTGKMKELILSRNYTEGYNLGLFITAKYPSYFGVYKELFPLLDVLNREAEFHTAIQKFRRLFPDSDIHYRWLADFYMTRDEKKFIDIMEKVNIQHVSEKAVKAYLFILCRTKNFSNALALCSLFKSNPRFSHIIPEVIKESGNTELWRKNLLEGAAEKDEAGYYYAMGIAEMMIGLDPVMYWKKGYSLDVDPAMMRDLSDLYENSILGVNDFYSGIYTDLHPEFRWNGKKRKITIHIFESGRIVIEGEDIIPSGDKIREEKYSRCGSEFSSGAITTMIPLFKGIKILYVLTAKDGLSASADFKSELTVGNCYTVKFTSSGDEEFSVIKYSGEYEKNEVDVFNLVKNLMLKAPEEKISELDYEVICHGNFNHNVQYNGVSLSAGKYSDGSVKYSVREKFSEEDRKSVVSEILKFPSESIFVEWYSFIIRYAGKPDADYNKEFMKEYNKADMIKEVHSYVMSVISKRGYITFTPRNSGLVLRDGAGTVEERTLLAKMILEKRGIVSFVSFKKGKNGLIEKILLYIPENRDKGYWLDFYGEVNFNKMESGYDALVITGEGYKTFPVNPETYIR